jgi:hypothetical protein
MDSLSYYAQHSPITDPGQMAHLFAGLPPDIPALRRIARGLVVHFRVDDLQALGIPDARVEEVDTRYAERMLRRLVELDARPLTDERPKDMRLVGCCRDYTVLFLAMLRHQGIPARGRIGFGSYFVPGWNVDHEVAEVWDAAEDRWRLVDAEIADTHVDPSDGFEVDATDVPRDRLRVGGEAWRACRSGEADPQRFVVDPGLEIPETRGWPQLAYNLVQDLATLNKAEMLLWDEWGLLTSGSLSAHELALLDRVAAATHGEDTAFGETQFLYASEPGLRVPGVVTSTSPRSGSAVRVKVAV